ncbi:hypothetical protein RJ498_000815 [Pluralibacter gergoviae]
MKKIAPLTWVGLIVNLLVCGIMWFNFTAGTEPGFDYRSNDIWFYSAMAFSVGLVLQIIALLLLSHSPKWGRVCAIIGVIIMVPIGLIFLMGYMSSYERSTTTGFTTYSQEAASADTDVEDVNTVILLKFKTSQMFLSGMLMLVIGAVILVMGTGTGGILVGVGILALINGSRLKDRVIIGIKDNMLVVTPGIYSETCILPLKDVTVVKLHKGYIKLRLKTAEQEKTFKLHKNIIDSDDVDGALDKILPLLKFESVPEKNPV